MIDDPEKFAELIHTNKQDQLYVFVEKGFTAVEGVLESLSKTYKTFLPSVMFTDIVINYHEDSRTDKIYQYYNMRENDIIYSPVAVKNFPNRLRVYPHLKYHSFSFFRQLKKIVLPWHIPVAGFEFSLDSTDFATLSEQSKWVLQQETL